MGRFFASFEQAWEFCLHREEDLEDFFALFPDDDAFLLGWLLQMDAALVPAMQEVKRSFSHLDWITPQPDHFLHTWLGGVALAPQLPSPGEIEIALERAERAWEGFPSFDISYKRVNCFHRAVVVEVEGNGARNLVEKLVEADYWDNLPISGALARVQMETFLPHVTIGTVKRPNDPEPLRRALTPLRDAHLGRQRVSEATLCIAPASRRTILDPWRAVASVGFR